MGGVRIPGRSETVVLVGILGLFGLDRTRFQRRENVSCEFGDDPVSDSGRDAASECQREVDASRRVAGDRSGKNQSESCVQ